MKKNKIVITLGLIIILLVAIAPIIARITSYTIKTNGKLYIVNKLSQSISVFDLYEGKELLEIPITTTPHQPITINNEQNLVVINDRDRTKNVRGRSLTIINTKTDKIEKIIDFKQNLTRDGVVDFQKPNTIAVVTSSSHELIQINIDTEKIEKIISTGQSSNRLLALHPTKSIAYISNFFSGSVSIIDLNLNKVIKIISCGLGTEGIAVRPDGNEVWVTNIKENSISVINTQTNKITHTLTTGQESYRLNFSINGRYCLVTNSKDGTISVYNTNNKKLIKIITLRGKTNYIQRFLFHTPRPVRLLMHPNGLYAFVSNSNADEVEVIDMKSFTVVSTIKTKNTPLGMAIVE